jgi:hypothetical protein
MSKSYYVEAAQLDGVWMSAVSIKLDIRRLRKLPFVHRVAYDFIINPIFLSQRRCSNWSLLEPGKIGLRFGSQPVTKQFPRTDTFHQSEWRYAIGASNVRQYLRRTGPSRFGDDIDTCQGSPPCLK